MGNEAYEVTEDLMTGTYTVRIGNPVQMPYSIMGVKMQEENK